VARVIRDLDAVVVVVPQRGLRRDLDELAQRLSFIGIPVLGYVLTRGPLRTDRTPSAPVLTRPERPQPSESAASAESPASAVSTAAASPGSGSPGRASSVGSSPGSAEPQVADRRT